MKVLEINMIRQLRLLAYFFVFFNLLNVAGILIYHTRWSELYSELDFVLVLSFVFWGLFLCLKVGYRFIRKPKEQRISI